MMKDAVRRAGWAVVVIGGLVGLGLAAPWGHATPESPKFRTVAISKGPITQAVLASGTLQPVVVVSVGTQVSGTVLERLADFNDRVKKGQVLLRLDPASLQARLRQARAQLASARASLTLALTTLERNQGLNEQGFISAPALDQSRREHDAARANVDIAVAQVDAAQTDLSNTVVRSPIDGVVIRRTIDVGQTVAASFQTPDLFQLAQDLRRMLIHASVAENDVGMVRNGQEARFFVDAHPDREFIGKVAQVRLNASSNQGVVTYTAVIEVNNAEDLLKPGMTAQTRIVVASKQQVLRIPSAALRFRPDEEELRPEAAVAAPNDGSHDGVAGEGGRGVRMYRVHTVGDKQKPKPHQVTIGLANTRFSELVGGDLKEGDAVIVQLAPRPESTK
jgi:HlyD family secretion protein